MEEKIIFSLKNLLAETSEVAIAREVAIYHDIARISYPFQPNKVERFEDFTKIITNYYSHHTSLCGERGKHHLSPIELSTQAIQVLEEEYRNHGEDIFASYKDARDGTNGGLMIILDIIAERLKVDSVEQYIQSVFKKYVSSIPPEWRRLKWFVDLLPGKAIIWDRQYLFINLKGMQTTIMNSLKHM